tara:strand:- start:281 stop:712 length:432 start_codon:yes stop_codon:yes gene_type:complete
MDEDLLKQLKDTILKTINAGIAFPHMTEQQRDEKEKEIVVFLQEKGYEAFVEECMIYVLGKGWDKILMMELTRNTLYFTPFKLTQTTEIVFYILQLVAKKYLDKVPVKKKKVPKQKEEKEEEIEEDSDEDTEEDKPPPDFSFL